jgi:hypothetical protein
MTEQASQLEEEIESWKGFPWALRKDDLELWDAMIREVRDDFREAVEKSGKPLTTDPFFMALLLAQQRMIKRLQGELRSLGVGMSASNVTTQVKLD